MSEDLSPWYEARDKILAGLDDELAGPVEAVALNEPPLNRIVVGVLHPRRSVVASTESEYHEGIEADEAQEFTGGTPAADGATESAVALSHATKPSSMGLTFTVDPRKTPEIEVVASARRYESAESGEWLPTDVRSDPAKSISTSTPTRIDEPIAEGDRKLRLVGIVRPAVDGQVRVTLSLVNGASEADITGHSDAHCWFRPQIVVSAIAGGFIDRRRPRETESQDPDARSSEFLYRNEPSLAVGHGCAVIWDELSDVVRDLRTTFIPVHDVRLARPSGGDASDAYGTYRLSMSELSRNTDYAQLDEMASAYERWIAERRQAAEQMPVVHRKPALEHMALAATCAKRIRKGIDALEEPIVARAFRLMNEAMVEQRNAQDKARGAAPGEQEWRPFQLAFVLMNIPAIADPLDGDRDVVDLLWFPTGGGKTEAYLGCIAFSILLRRLRREDDGGVSAIMRYTLRLLTRQQFERAAGLICALELIRRRELPQTKSISLGLWVGNQATPNKVEEAREILNKYAAGDRPEGSTPVQLLRCPWCGAGLSHRDYDASNRRELIISCPNSSCDFSNGLPCWVTDQDVYREKPSLIIGTVDKFALMAWRQEVGPLLSVDGPDSRPDLIVQDELHLISGPLGTMVGLYESALDLACTDAGRPKVLASTATIRRAQHQVRKVFDRESVQFPPPGLDPSDNYFSVEATAEQKGTRRYVGVMAPGTSQATMLVRLYSSLLQSAHALKVDDRVRDDYWTLLGYFNSLRVLGSTYLQVLDDVPDRLKVVAARRGSDPRLISQEPVELTSRVDQTRIPTAMASLEASYPSSDSPDVVLATNMISVGLDIDRLGLMVVAGQPQSTSEYIQSTSRVGRRHPGLVVVALNAQRSRDASHYESFIPFHRALYREVEATTATPFASRARDRGAHGTLVSAIRLLVQGLRDDGSVSKIERYRSEVDGIVDSLISRATRVSPEEADAFADQLKALVSTWSESAERDQVDNYGKMSHPKASRRRSTAQPLLTSASDGSQPASYPVMQPAWPTLSSMRDVDVESRMFEKYLAREAQSDGSDPKPE